LQTFWRNILPPYSGLAVVHFMLREDYRLRVFENKEGNNRRMEKVAQ
jgi:hypothetical protein